VLLGRESNPVRTDDELLELERLEELVDIELADLELELSDVELTELIVDVEDSDAELIDEAVAELFWLGVDDLEPPELPPPQAESAMTKKMPMI
jgi:hypothetical protein